MRKVYRIEVEFDCEDPERELVIYCKDTLADDFIRERVDVWEDVTEESK